MNSLKHRNLQPELMDQPGLDPSEHRAALRGLGRVNRISRSLQILWPPIARLAAAFPQRPLKILDVACGGGDLPLQLWQKGQQLPQPPEIYGCDISEFAIEYSRQAATNCGANVEFFQHDALNDPLPTNYDVVTSSLFLHHLEDEPAGVFVRALNTSHAGLVVINDLHRSRLGLVMAQVGCRLLSRSPIVHFDGPASVRGAMTADEAVALCHNCGLENVVMTRHWPQRYRLLWSPSGKATAIVDAFR